MSVTYCCSVCFVLFCLFLYRPFCHGSNKRELSTLFTTSFSLSFSSIYIDNVYYIRAYHIHVPKTIGYRDLLNIDIRRCCCQTFDVNIHHGCSSRLLATNNMYKNSTSYANDMFHLI